jgi:hypothetical protein
MKKFAILFFLGLLFLTGCLQSSEHLTINKDGSGTLEVSDVIPFGTVKLIDTMLGGMVKGMSEAFGSDEQKQKAPESMAVEMFANKEQIVKNAGMSGVDVEVVDFAHSMESGSLRVDYTLKFSDVNKLLASN